MGQHRAYCPARFADGTLRSAQARHAVRLMASRLAIDIAQPTLSRCDGIDSLDVDTDSLAAMAAAEDQVGFAMEVFAARSFGHATLDISDRHKTTSQRLISLSGAEDNRAKTYDVTQLLANPNTIVDSATACTRQPMRPGNELRAQRNRSRCGKLDFVERLDEVPNNLGRPFG